MDDHYVNPCAGEGHQKSLECKYVKEYLLSRGYLLEDLDQLPPSEAKRLMREACQYASFRLAEIEARVNFLRKIRFRRI